VKQKLLSDKTLSLKLLHVNASDNFPNFRMTRYLTCTTRYCLHYHVLPIWPRLTWMTR